MGREKVENIQKTNKIGYCLGGEGGNLNLIKALKKNTELNVSFEWQSLYSNYYVSQHLGVECLTVGSPSNLLLSVCSLLM